MAQARLRLSLFHCPGDAVWAERMTAHLNVLGEVQRFDVWTEHSIAPGADRRVELAYAALADVVALLISVDWLQSQLKGLDALLLARLRAARPTVPVIVSPCAWQHIDWLKDLAALPPGGRAFTSFGPAQLDDAIAHTAQALADIVACARVRSAAPAGEPAWEPTVSASEAPISAVPAVARVGPRSVVRVRSLWAWLACGVSFVLGVSGARIWPHIAGGLAPRMVQPVPRGSAAPLPATTALRFESVRLGIDGQIAERREYGARVFAQALSERAELEMIVLPAGTFLMGSPPNEPARAPDEGPQRLVHVAAFAIGRFEVTQEEWYAVALLPPVERDLPRTPAHFQDLPGTPTRRPIERVTWHEAREFCARLRVRTGRAYRLPSEAEWEYAARAGAQTPFAFGETLTDKVAIFNAARPYGAAPVGRTWNRTELVGALRMGVNGFGLADVHGNVWEWVEDPWHDDYADAPLDGRAWLVGGNPSLRVLRGGAWRGEPGNCRSATRGYARPADSYNHLGFRVACDLPPAAQD